MTAARQKRKRLCAGFTAMAGVLMALMAGPPASVAATTERLVVDWHTGMAIGGYDPVAFFTDGRPVAGSANFELRYAGAIWRFRNVGNRDAFAAQPDIYMPKFGGYDPIGVHPRCGGRRQPECLAHHWRTALPVLRPRPAGTVRQRCRSLERRGRTQMARRQASAQPLTRTALAGSPQARKAGINRSLLP